jgi:Protein of unknown function (DUF1559)
MGNSPDATDRRAAGKARAAGLASAILIGLAGVLGADDPDPRALVQIKKHLSRIGEEMFGYRGEGGTKTLPWAIRDKSGKPLLSWRVAILPQLGEVELYRKFKLDEPWDSPSNKPLVEKMPAIFAPLGPGSNSRGSTFFQVLVGPGTLFGDKAGLDLRSIPDGADSTLIIIEAAEAVPWTKPADLTYDPKGPLPRFGGHFKEGSLALFADGSVAFIRAKIDEPTLRALITRDGAEMVARSTLRDHVIPIRRR